MFHRFQDVMHELKNKHPLELKALLKETEPHRNFIKTLDELKRYYWMYSALVQDGMDRMRRAQLNYHQSRRCFDKLRMEAAEQDYLKQLETLKSYTVFYACHHYLGTAGFEHVSLD